MQSAHQLLAAWRASGGKSGTLFPASRQIETNGIFETARQLSVTILAYSPLAQGYSLASTRLIAQNSGCPPDEPRFSKDGLKKLNQ